MSPGESAGFHPLCEPIAVTKGGVSAVAVHLREVFCEAIRGRAHAVIVAPNHPSGDATPSEQDGDLTRKLIEAAKIVRIPILDHLVIATGGFTSIRGLAVLSFAWSTRKNRLPWEEQIEYNIRLMTRLDSM